jgi:hypothetical protein
MRQIGRMDRMRQFGRRVAHGVAVHPGLLGIGSIAALVTACLVLWNLASTSKAQEHRAERFHGAPAAEAASSDRPRAAAGGSHETGITPRPTLERPILAAKPEPPAIPPPPLPRRRPRTSADSPKPTDLVSAGRHVSAEPKESSSTNWQVASNRPRAPAGSNRIESGLKSTFAPRHQPGLVPRGSTPAPPVPHPPRASQGIAEVKGASTAESKPAATSIKAPPPPPATVAYKRGMAAFYSGSFDRAIADFTEALRIDPNLFEARLYRGIIHALARRPQDALADYTAAIGLERDHPEPYLERAKVYIDLDTESLGLELSAEGLRLLTDSPALAAERIELLNLLQGCPRSRIDGEVMSFLELDPDSLDLGEIGPEFLLQPVGSVGLLADHGK